MSVRVVGVGVLYALYLNTTDLACCPFQVTIRRGQYLFIVNHSLLLFFLLCAKKWGRRGENILLRNIFILYTVSVTAVTVGH